MVGVRPPCADPDPEPEPAAADGLFVGRKIVGGGVCQLNVGIGVKPETVGAVVRGGM